jgi:hypothetical protein
MGLLQQSSKTLPGLPSPPEQAQPAPTKVEDGEGNVTPEEQKAYEEFVANALTLIHTPKGPKPEVLEALKVGGEQAEGAPNPFILALAQSAVTIVGKLDDSAAQAGKQISDDVLFHGAQAVIEELVEVAEAAQIHEFTEEDVNGAFFQAIDLYRPKLIESGRTTEEELKGLFAEINEADAQGSLGQMLPGLPATGMEG